jgi:serpin B
MLTRRQVVRAVGGLGAAGIAAPGLDACTGVDSVADHPGNHPIRLVKADVARSAGQPAAVDGVVAAVRSFATDLWGQVGGSEANLALSPYSIAVALAMTANGAASATARQMLEVLHVDSLAAHNTGMAALTQELQALAGPVTLRDDNRGAIALATADQLFGDRSGTGRSSPSSPSSTAPGCSTSTSRAMPRERGGSSTTGPLGRRTTASPTSCRRGS